VSGSRLLSARLLSSIAAAEQTLADAGVPSARHDAEALAAHLLGVPRTRLTLTDGAVLDEAAYTDLVGRRAAREPLQHLVGVQAFRRIDLEVGPGVFIPRPETEVVVEAALAELPRTRRKADSGPVVVDLCAGSGTIALSIAVERPHAEVHAVERDPVAFGWLRRNAARIAPEVSLVLADVADPRLLASLDGIVDVVVSNPPYIPVGAVPLEPEVLEYDPHLALFGGEDGLDVVRTVEKVAARLLRPGGVVVVEHADLQGASAPAVFATAGGWDELADHLDLSGRNRFLTARRSQPG
jgi:release factor glutamine methyltransferase